MKIASWVIIDLLTDKAVLETFDIRVASAINTEKYKAVPILEYLQNLNRQIKQTS